MKTNEDSSQRMESKHSEEEVYQFLRNQPPDLNTMEHPTDARESVESARIDWLDKMLEVFHAYHKINERNKKLGVTSVVTVGSIGNRLYGFPRSFVPSP